MAAPTNKEKLLIQVLRKIPIFNGLAPTQVKKILGLCQHKSYKPGERVFESGSRPDEMFILLSGELAIITPEGLRVATILPVTTIGEIGVITGQPRVASVEVTKTGALFTIQKAQFDAILREDQDMQAKVFRAIIGVLSGKLSNDNVRLRDYQMERARYEGRIAVLQRRLKGNQSRVAIALDIGGGKDGDGSRGVEPARGGPGEGLDPPRPHRRRRSRVSPPSEGRPDRLRCRRGGERPSGGRGRSSRAA